MSDKDKVVDQEEPRDPENAGAGHFDKFIDDITRREQEAIKRHKEYVDSHDENPQLERNRLYRELPQNKTRWRR
jgi:hypothetical protein